MKRSVDNDNAGEGMDPVAADDAGKAIASVEAATRATAGNTSDVANSGVSTPAGGGTQDSAVPHPHRPVVERPVEPGRRPKHVARRAAKGASEEEPVLGMGLAASKESVDRNGTKNGPKPIAGPEPEQELAKGTGSNPRQRGGCRGWSVWPVASIAVLLCGIAILVVTLIWASNNNRPSQQPSQGAGALAPSGPLVSAAAATPGEATGKGIAAGVDPQWVKTLAGKTGIPVLPLTAYAGASLRVQSENPGCGLGWNTLAAIGLVESGHGEINGSQLDAKGKATPPIVGIALTGQTTKSIPDTDGGALDGDFTWDRAVGPMQFIPSTWKHWAADGDGDGAKDPQNIYDATLAAARYLCHAGRDLTQPDHWIAAIAAYNNSIEYNNRIAEAASYYAKLG